ncbi:MAG: hypothetical protein CO094_11620 [Anaerolineae bacterium CG_4_9_14_3_um_filter_57_17]|nr:hypothetical protein [bacterium]NCT20566.1 hypothetical protein [bacterium]OIO86317.1 MAG: hypothetical protein AUK01_03465 [Anaerolineae bacterium CG2_30_57_67]PJB64865.1 MAG: hypothetical protein CO094_11620 [Anaerolineae bacterium CG_4_9_14_3_um_filter_57_17]
MKKTFFLFWIKSGLLLALTACSAPQAAAPTPTLAAATESATRAPLATPRLVTPTPSTSETPTATEATLSAESSPAPAAETPSAACAYVWASQPLNETSAALFASLQASGLNVEAASASAYGENCLDAAGALISFAAMQTDYTITLRTESPQERGKMLYIVLLNLQALFPVESTPGPNPGQLTLIFSAPDGETRLTLPRAEAISALLAGKTGEEMMGGE